MPSAWRFAIHPIKELGDRYVGEVTQGGYEGITLILPIHINKLAGFVTFERFTYQVRWAFSAGLSRLQCLRTFGSDQIDSEITYSWPMISPSSKMKLEASINGLCSLHWIV
jgi:hypothetical protein